MPYLEFVKCAKCGGQLDIDPGSTIRAYHAEGRREKDTFINPATIVWDYLVYTCATCEISERFTFRNIEKKVRSHFSEQSERLRSYFESLDAVDLNDMGWASPANLSKVLRSQTAERLKRSYTKK